MPISLIIMILTVALMLGAIGYVSFFGH